MSKSIICKFSKSDAIYCKRQDLVGKDIVLYDNDRKHCYNRHYSEFKDKKVFSFVMKNLNYIITEKDFVLYNSKNNSLEYYKKLADNISIRVKVDNNDLKVKTLFIVPDDKYEDKKKRALYNHYVINNDCEKK